MNPGISSRAFGEIHSAPVLAFVLLLHVLNVQSCRFRRCPEIRPFVQIVFVLPMRRFFRVFAAHVITENRYYFSFISSPVTPIVSTIINILYRPLFFFFHSYYTEYLNSCKNPGGSIVLLLREKTNCESALGRKQYLQYDPVYKRKSFHEKYRARAGLRHMTVYVFLLFRVAGWERVLAMKNKAKRMRNFRTIILRQDASFVNSPLFNVLNVSCIFNVLAR